MPDQPPPKRSPASSHDAPCAPTSSLPYAELHCRTNFSFLEGASHPDELVQRAVQLGYRALAITDRNSLAGVVRAHVAARETNLKLLIGSQIVLEDDSALVLLAMNRSGYAHLSRLITRGRRRAEKGKCRLRFEDVARHAEGLQACLLPGWDANRLHQYRDVFGDRCSALVELHLGPDDRSLLQRKLVQARQANVPVAAANDVHYHVPERRILHDVLTAVRHGCTVAQLGGRMFPNSERFLKSPAQMAALFVDAPEAIERTLEIADACCFSLEELRYDYPHELCPPGLSAIEYLTRLTWDGARERYPQGVPEKVRRLIEYELRLIEELRYEAYFLTVWDLVTFARSRDIHCQGRGSAANSAVCFCLGVTSVDPERIDVLFERFVSKERNEAPDIDVDFEHERREEVLQYIYDKYGRERAAMTAEVITYRPRSAVRDVGKVLGLSPDRVDVLAKTLENYNEDEKLASRFREAGLDPVSPIGRRLITLVREMLGFPRHLSQHVGGMVITHEPLCELVPIENAAMPERTVIQWDKDDLDALGILKVDCLALGMLTAIHKCFDLIRRHTDSDYTLATVPAEDPAVYDMVSRADTVGIFQIESRAQMSMLPRLRPQCFYDLVIEVAIVRPGPIQGNMVHPYLRRRNGEELVEYPGEAVREVLQKTLGVPIFQEQAMRLAVVAAGFTPGEADQLRRAMGAWRKRGIIDRFQQKLTDGMLANGYTLDFAERLFQQIRGFGEYGFPESHAASFALLVYVSSWLKHYHPAAFAAALLNSQPMGFYAPAQLVADARKHGVEVFPIDVNASDWDCTLESRDDRLALRLGMRQVKGLSHAHVARILAAREGGPFTSLDDLAARTQLGNSVLTRLARADLFGSVTLNRRAATWDALPPREQHPLFDDATEAEPAAPLPEMSSLSEVIADYRTAGLSLRAHPVSFLRQQLDDRQAVRAEQLATLPPDRRYRVAGIVLLRQRPSTASGITFVTLEDETGTANLIIRPDVWERHHHVARRASAILAHGTLQRQNETIHLLVDRLEDLSASLANAQLHARDFH